MTRLPSPRAAAGIVLGAFLLPLLVAAPAPAHVGSPNVFFEGMAGDYHVRVIIRPPGVVPGLAEIAVRVSGAENVAIRLFRWDVGEDGAPPAEPAVPVPGEDGLYSAELWLMTAGAHSVEVVVQGSDGEGSALVPFESIRRETLQMEAWYARGLMLMAAFLFVGAVTIFGASVRESTLAPGESVDAHRRTRGRVAAGLGTAMLLAMLWGGWNWWSDIDSAYRNAIFEPMATEATATVVGDDRLLALTITERDWMEDRWTPLVPDHGKLIHMFLVRDDLEAFAHVHPVRQDKQTFHLNVPPLPAGRYRLYADIVHESGFTQTLVNEVDLPAPPAAEATDDSASGSTGGAIPAADPDDSWSANRFSGDTVTFEDGTQMDWIRPAEIRTGVDLTLEFAVRGPDGQPAALEPYMGMVSHSAITRPDGEVFVHLHPTGSISMGALRVETERRAGSAGHTMMTTTGRVAFPYAFPRPGTYRMWVQIKRDGVVHTGNFDFEVT